MSKSFKGVAYWEGQGIEPGWGQSAAKLLAPLSGVGGSAGYDEANNRLNIAVGDAGIALEFVGGNTQGLVKQGDQAGCLVACLLAVRKHLGKLVIVDDERNEVPERIRQAHPLFAANWARVQEVGQALGLLADNAFHQKHAALLGRLV